MALRIAFASLFLISSALAQDEVIDFCNRWDHQSIVKNDRLYIDGGNQVYKSPSENGKPYIIGINRKLITVDLSSSWDWKKNISVVALEKTANPNTGTSPPNMIQAGMYAGSQSDPNIYVFGGAKSQLNTSFANAIPDPSTYSLWSYDTSAQSWNQYDVSSGVALRPSRGAYAEALDQGLAFYYNGKSSSGSSSLTTNMGSKVAGMKGLIMLNMTSTGPVSRNLTTTSYGLDAAVGGSELVYIPQVGLKGILIELGGALLSTTAADQNGTMIGLESVNILDVTSVYNGDGAWYSQATSGNIPPPRTDACTVVTAAPDGSSYNIYLYAGRDPTTSTYYDDIYILSIPSFTWTKMYGGDSPRWGHTCHLVGKGSRQLLTVGGIKSRNWTASCDWEEKSVAIMDLSTKQWGSVFNAFADNYTVTSDLLPVIGGTIMGGATMLEPQGGFTDPSLKAVFEAKRVTTEVAATPPPLPSESATIETSKTPAGAIAGGVVAAVAVFSIVAGIILFVMRRKRRQAISLPVDAGAPPAYEKRGEYFEMNGNDQTAAELPVKSAHEMPAVIPVYELADEQASSRQGGKLVVRDAESTK